MSEEAFQFLTVCYVCYLVLSELIFKRFLLSGYIYPFNLFHIEPLIVHLHLNDVLLI
jgi:hypothetical protein